jgi:hypothetical protein
VFWRFRAHYAQLHAAFDAHGCPPP